MVLSAEGAARMCVKFQRLLSNPQVLMKVSHSMKDCGIKSEVLSGPAPTLLSKPELPKP